MIRLLFVYSLVIVCFITPCLAGEFETMDSLDLETVRTRKPGSWVEAVFWPTDATLRTRAYTGDLKPEKTALIQILQHVMKKEYLPSESLVKQKTVGIANLRNGNDSLFLEYKTRNNWHIQITDERFLCVSVKKPDAKPVALSEIGSFAWQTAATVFAFPAFQGEGPQKPVIRGPGSAPMASSPEMVDRPSVPVVSIYPNQISPRSWVGMIEYGRNDRAGLFECWYSHISWWSDGHKVVFCLSKITPSQMDTPNPQSFSIPIPPRVFQSRKAE